MAKPDKVVKKDDTLKANEIAKLKDDTLKANEIAKLKSDLEKLGLKIGDLDKEVKADVKRGDLAAALIAILRAAPKKK